MADPTSITIHISPGEVLDRLTILEIKSERMTDAAKLANVRHELEELAAVVAKTVPIRNDIRALHVELKTINAKLWEIEDEIRDCERGKDFGEKFVALARAVYITNDERSRVKRSINEALGAGLIEEKSYQPY
ncbi:MAG: hypothetical protein ACI82H_002027 [Alphaproteobacteria bacterium]|jgi:hypothetical protein